MVHDARFIVLASERQIEEEMRFGPRGDGLVLAAIAAVLTFDSLRNPR